MLSLFIRHNILCTLDKSLVTEIESHSQKYFLACAYHSPSQS